MDGLPCPGPQTLRQAADGMVHSERHLGMHLAGLFDSLLVHIAEAELSDEACYRNHVRHRKWLPTSFDLGVDHLGLERS